MINHFSSNLNCPSLTARTLHGRAFSCIGCPREKCTVYKYFDVKNYIWSSHANMLMSRVTFVLVIQICWCQELHLVWSYKYVDVKNYIWSRITFGPLMQICWCQELHLFWSYKYADVKNYIWSGHTNVLMSRITFGLVMQICWCQGQTGPRRPQSLWIKPSSWLLTVTLVHKYTLFFATNARNSIRNFV